MTAKVPGPPAANEGAAAVEMGTMPPRPVKMKAVSNTESLGEDGVPQNQKKQNNSPEAKANILSLITFMWVFPLVWKGWRRPLEEADLYDLIPQDEGENLYNKFEKHWSKERVKKKPSIALALWKAWGLYYIMCGGIKMIQDICLLSTPVFLQFIISAVNNDEPIWKPFAWAGGLLVAMVLRSQAEEQYFHRVYRTGVRIRGALVMALYKKSLALSAEARGLSTVGEITNLMSNDSQRFQEVLVYMHVLWSGPFQIIIALGLLCRMLGWAPLVGAIILFLNIPLQKRLGEWVRVFRKKQMKVTDKRVRLINEILQGIKIIKLYAWESFFARQLSSARKSEMWELRKSSVVRATIMTSMIATPVIVAAVTFIIYVVAPPYGTLTADKVFPALALFNIMRFPMLMLPMVINNLAESRVSLKRLSVFLLRGETQAQDRLDTLDDDFKARVDIALADYKWALGNAGEKLPDAGPKSKAALPIRVLWCLLNVLERLFFAKRHRERLERRAAKEEAKAAAAKAEKDAKAAKVKAAGDATAAVKKSPEASPAAGPAVAAPALSAKDQKELVKKEKQEKKAADALWKAQEAQDDADRDEAGDGTEVSQFMLDGISFSASGQDLVMVVGKVASGKSSLVSAMLGEMMLTKGTSRIRGRVAYCAQQPWIMNATLRENILFGKRFDEARYYETLYSCSLVDDIAILPGGDMTEIGEKGINLSGGQKARVSLARAMYQDADVYVLDDPLSAVDTHVGAHIFNHCIRGALKSKLVIFITNQLQWVDSADVIYRMEKGKVAERGTFPELIEARGAFFDLIEKHTGLAEKTKKGGGPPGGFSFKGLFGKKTKPEDEAQRRLALETEKSNAIKELTVKLAHKNKGDRKVDETDKTTKGKLVNKEHRETGAVALRVYISYFMATGLVLGPILLVVVLNMYFAVEVVRDSIDFWLMLWSNDTLERETWFYIAVYVSLALFLALFSWVRSLIFAEITIRSSTSLHAKLVKGIQDAKMEFFDTTPIGRVLNRFSKDIDMIDSQLSMAINMSLNTIFTLIGACLIVSYVTPWFLLFLPPIFVIYYCIQQFYRGTGRQLRRLDGSTRSPLYALFSETLGGASTIRAYNHSARFSAMNETMLNDNQKAYYLVNAANRWLSFNLSFCGTLIVAFTSLVGIATAYGGTLRTINASELGLSLVYSMSFAQYLQMMVRTVSNLESIMSSVERVAEYQHLEAEDKGTGATVPHDWPSKGGVDLKGVVLRYRAHLPDVLKGLTFSIRPQEKIGVVGRTGAGKSSILVALFRLVNLQEGSILIDGVDIATITPHALRSRLAIIPQDPVLFSGTLRNNLDPERKHSDDDLWKVLSKIEMKESVAALPGQLRTSVKEYGENFSVGERQLICLGRALLRGSKVLMLDEATAAVDIETDAKIQKTIAHEFRDCTVITIAHRLNTIMESDRVLVMDNGVVAEYDTPHNLFQLENGIFHDMVRKMGVAQADYLKGIAAAKHTVSGHLFASTPEEALGGGPAKAARPELAGALVRDETRRDVDGEMPTGLGRQDTRRG